MKIPIGGYLTAGGPSPSNSCVVEEQNDPGSEAFPGVSGNSLRV